MKCYVNYYHKGTFKDQLVYKEQEVNVDLDLADLKKLNAPIKLKIEKDGIRMELTARSAPCGFVPLRQSRRNAQRGYRIAPAH